MINSGVSILFITGTGTGVGKTVAAGIVLHELRRRGVHVLGLKPFCTGPRSDVLHLRRIQGNELGMDEINPFWFKQPLAPIAAVQSRASLPALENVVRHVRETAARCDALVIEGAGGVLVPLGPIRRQGRGGTLLAGCYTAADIIAELKCSVLVVAPNRLGTINHTLMTVRCLPAAALERTAVLLMGQRVPDLAARNNEAVLRRLVAPVKLFLMPYLGPNPLAFSHLKNNRKKFKNDLADLLRSAIVSSLFGKKRPG
jgi:dethiobiotin synthetase